MTKNFDNPLRYPLFGEDGNPDVMFRQRVGLHNGGRLEIKGGYQDRIFLSTGGSYWTLDALDQAIAALLHIRQEWREELEARGAVLPGDWPDDDLEEDGDEDEGEVVVPVEPAEGPMEAVRRARDEMVRAAEQGDPGINYRAWLEARGRVFGGPVEDNNEEPEENDPNF